MKIQIQHRAYQTLGTIALLVTAGFSTPTLAQTGCAGAIGIATDPVTIGNPIVFTEFPLQAPVSISVNPAAGAGSLPLTLDNVDFALTCANNQSDVPCVNGNDVGAIGGALPITFVGLAADSGTCGVNVVTENPVDLGQGTIRFEFPAQALDELGCTINFDVLVNDKGGDDSPLQLTPAAETAGECLFDGGSIVGQASGSASIFLQTVPGIDLLKEISIDGGTTWFDANDAANAPFAGFPSGAEYRLIVTNTGTADLVNLVVNDPTLGVVDENVGGLAAGQSVTLDSGNIAALSAPLVCDSSGTFENIASVTGSSADDGSTASDSDPANLVCVGIDVEKTASPLSKVGDVVDYQISLINQSGVDLDNCQAEDSLLATGFGPAATLPVAGLVLDLDREVLADDPDPLVNTVVLSCEVQGPVNTVTLTATASAETNLFQPSVSVSKTGPETSKTGDAIDYTVVLSNTSSSDTPETISCTATDPLKDGGAPFAIAFGVDNAVNYSATPPAGASVTNTVSVECSVENFTNIFGASDSHTVELVGPMIDVIKTGPDFAEVGDSITYTIGFTAGGDGAVENCMGVDDVLGDLGAFEAGVNRTFDYVVQQSDPDPLVNIATITCDVVGLDNQVSDSDTHSLSRFGVPEVVPALQGPWLLMLAAMLMLTAMWRTSRS
ncbi:MAG: hypothetical protein RQ741_00940 [Wenzhouxiangellaceae bacterium]|nr:hypothetical protein [Wenzhouxiangellaceae bacterium]